MKFKPVTATYKFQDDELISIYPDYLQVPLTNWIKNVLVESEILFSPSHYSGGILDVGFINNLNINLREAFPNSFNIFAQFIFADNDRTTNFLGVCLQNYATIKDAVNLEKILSIGGSAYAVMITDKNAGNYDQGIADLADRVSEIVTDVSEKALNNEQLIREAWHACYSRNPDYEKTVSKCCDVIEKMWGQKYFTSDPKPQIKKFVHGFMADPSKLAYKGSTIVNPKNLLTSIADQFSDIRGQHTAGKGRTPSRDEAEMVLNYTIFIWNIDK